jgi:hypothetical protein
MGRPTSLPKYLLFRNTQYAIRNTKLYLASRFTRGFIFNVCQSQKPLSAKAGICLMFYAGVLISKAAE